MTGDDDNGIGDRTEVVPYDQATRRPGQAGPKRLGRYTLEKIIAQGGMAEIWLAAVDGPAGFQKKVIVKRIRPGLIKQALRQQQQEGAPANRAVEMFVREARLLARLEHRNIVQVFELGVQPSKREGEPGEHFIVMEYLDGLTLKDLALRSWEAGQPLPIETIVRVVADACLGLDHAHRLKDERGQPANLVHRDISPDNLFVTGTGATKLLDFGIAKREDWSNLTQAGELKGKVPYMAPEQLKGQRLDARTDLFAIGVVLYWLLAGRRPFDGPSDIFTMKAILDDPPPSLRQHNPNVPPMLEDIVMGCLQKEPGERISSAAALHDALSMVLLSTPGVQVEVSTLVAALSTVATPGFEVVPEVAAVPSARWGTLRPPGAPRGATVAVPVATSADADTELQIDPADIPSTIPPPTEARAIPVTGEDPARQRATPSLLPLPPVPAPHTAQPPPPLDLPPSFVAATDRTRPASRPAWKSTTPPTRDTAEFSLAALDTRPQQRAPGISPSITLPQPMLSPVTPSSPGGTPLVAAGVGAILALVVLGGLAWGFDLLSGGDGSADAGPGAGSLVAVTTVVDAGAPARVVVDAGVVVGLPADAVVDAGSAARSDAGASDVEDADAGGELPEGDIDEAVDEVEDGGVASSSQRPRRRRPPPRLRSPAATGEGFLVVQARPWARVAIDGLGVGPTPLPAMPLPAGKHRVKLEHDGVVKFQTVDIEPQKTTTIQVDMRE